jgi:hypothetical protein
MARYHAFMVEFFLAVLAALRVFFRSRGRTALEILPCDSRLPCSDANRRGQSGTPLTGCSGRPCAACGLGWHRAGFQP